MENQVYDDNRETKTKILRPEKPGSGNLEQDEDIERKEYLGDCVTEAYRLKSDLFSKSYTEIGMGRYQWEMFVVAGMGWLVNNLTVQGLSAALVPIQLEFNPKGVSYATVAYYIGSAVGSGGWGIAADFIGRRPSFNLTIFWTAIFFIASAGANNFISFCTLQALVGFGTGGNAAIDILLFLECLPASQQWLIALLYTWWSTGQLIASLVSWVYLAHYSCPTDFIAGECRRQQNMGWRYSFITLGLLSLAFALIRMLVFKLPESTQYLLSVGRDRDAIAALNLIAAKNGKSQNITLLDLEKINQETASNSATNGTPRPVAPREGKHLSRIIQVLQRSFADLKGEKFKAIFSTRKMSFHVMLLWTISLTIGMGYTLYFNFVPSYLAAKFTADTSLNATYRTYCIVSAVGIAGPLVASFLIETRLGRRWIMAIFFVLTGIFLYLYTTTRSQAASIGYQCAITVVGNLSFAILCVITPESFPAPLRGAGNGIAYSLQYLGMVMAPIITANTGFTTVPIYVSAGLWFFCGLLAYMLPFETRNRAAL